MTKRRVKGTTSLANPIVVSVVLPIFNESENIAHLMGELSNVLDNCAGSEWEIVAVDDGSTDDSSEKIRELDEKDKRIKLVELRRNFGQTAALAAGIRKASGRHIVTMDADGQNDPRDIPKLIKELNKGNDCVSGWRVNRKDRLLSRKVPSWLANQLIRRVTGLPLHDFGCSLKAYDARLLKEIPLYGDMHRLLPYYVHISGGKVKEIEVNHRPRIFGQSKYGIMRTFRVIQDLIVAKMQGSYFSRPMHFFGNLGLLLWVFATGLFAFALWEKVASIRDFTESPIILVAGIVFLTGLQLISTGILAEILLRRFNFTKFEAYYMLKND